MLEGDVDGRTLADDFSLRGFEDYDETFPNIAWAVGFHRSYPAVLKKRLCAALVTTQLGNASVDRTIRQYFSDADFESPPRAEEQYLVFLHRAHASIYDIVMRLTHHDDGTVGRILVEWSLLRQEFSAQCLLLLVNRGALFEGYSLLRMQLEQLAWTCAIDREGDAEKIKRTAAQSSITKLKTISPDAGPLYGLLSGYAHWSYDAHVRALHVAEGGGLGVLFSSVTHKIELMIAALVFSGVLAKTVATIRAAEIGALPDGAEAMAMLRKIEEDSRGQVHDLGKLLESHE